MISVLDDLIDMQINILKCSTLIAILKIEIEMAQEFAENLRVNSVASGMSCS